MEKLSARQQAILDFLQEFQERKGYSPSVREIQQGCLISSTSVVDYHLRLLEQKGYLRRDREVSRGIVRERPGARARVAEVPLLGAIAAGEPIEVPESSAWAALAEDSVPVPEGFLGGKLGVFALRVRGTSMIEDLIDDGDVVLIEQCETVENGATAVAWLKDEKRTTLKRYYQEGEKVRLQPANSALAPLYVDARNVQVQGRLIGLLRGII